MVVDVRTQEYPLFNSICIETAALCNRSCVFCPNHQKDRPDEFMPLELIWKMRDELAAIRYNGRLSLYIYNEPMRDPRLVEIASSFSEHVPRARLMLDTNGDYIKSAKDLKAIVEAGVRQFSINICVMSVATREGRTSIC